MSRILIISSGSPCRNPRPLKEAMTLGRAGHDVTLLTVSESPQLDAMEETLCAGAPFRHEAVGRKSNGLDVFLRRLQRRLAVQATVAGFPTLHALGQAGPLRRRAFALPADLTIVHNEIPFWIGRDLRRSGRRVAADFEDWHSEDLLPEARRSRPLAALRQLEQEHLLNAAYTTTTSTALSEALAERYRASPPQVLTNSFSLQPDPRSGAAGEPPALFWFSQTLGPGRGLEGFLAAWVRMQQPSRLVLLGQKSGSFAQTLLASVPPEFRSRLEFHDLVSATELPGLIARYDIGLALEPASSRNNDLTISNKILQYLNAGLAVVATATAGQREVMARAPGAGLLIDLNSPAATATALDEFLRNREQLVTAQRSARAAAENIYCWEREAPRLVQIVADALARPVR